LILAIATRACADIWQQCAGKQYTGPNCCVDGTTCVRQDEYYSQCRPGPAPQPSSSSAPQPSSASPAPTSAPTNVPTPPTSSVGIEFGTVTPNYLPPLPIKVNGVTLPTKVTIDANWRWIHTKKGFANCYSGTTWDKTVCPDSKTCMENCVIEGVSQSQYQSTYGVTTSGNSMTLDIITGSNIGSRLFLLEDDNKYFGFNLLNKEFQFTVDSSTLGCGLNGALYFVTMNLTNPDPTKAGPAYGLGYGDAQCPADIKYVNGIPNVDEVIMQPCSPEMDIWEANKISQAFTPHPCKAMDQVVCDGDIDCGNGKNNRYTGQCDKDGGDYNPYRHNITNFYGEGMTVDSTKPITVITQFITADGTEDGELIAIKRFFKQGSKVTPGGVITDDNIASWKKAFNEYNHNKELGGMRAMGKQIRNRMVLVLSVWGDVATNMAWLDGTYPPNSLQYGDKRGPCPAGTYEKSLQQNPRAKVTFSDIQLNPISDY